MSEGLLADYGIDTDDIEVPSFDVDDGIYYFEIGDTFVKEGSTNNPDLSWIIVEYLLEDEEGNSKGKIADLFQLPVDPEAPTEDERKKLGWYVARMLELGFERSQVNTLTRDDLVGLRGTLHVKTSQGKGKNKGKEYQNVSKVKLLDDQTAPAAEAPVVAAAKAPAAKRAALPAANKQTAPANPFAPK